MAQFDLISHRYCVKPTRLSLVERILGFGALQKERKELAVLTDQQLKDIGITPDQAAKEAARPGWDVPANWRKC